MRLACLIHAANVHSEPGSNPSILYASNNPPKRVAYEPRKNRELILLCGARSNTTAIRHCLHSDTAQPPKGPSFPSAASDLALAELNRSFITKLSKINVPESRPRKRRATPRTPRVSGIKRPVSTTFRKFSRAKARKFFQNGSVFALRLLRSWSPRRATWIFELATRFPERMKSPSQFARNDLLAERSVAAVQVRRKDIGPVLRPQVLSSKLSRFLRQPRPGPGAHGPRRPRGPAADASGSRGVGQGNAETSRIVWGSPCQMCVSPWASIPSCCNTLPSGAIKLWTPNDDQPVRLQR